MAIFGLAGSEHGPGHIVSSPIEHVAVAEPVARLESERFRVDRPQVNSCGVADPDLIATNFTEQTRLATLMLANNETGAIQPVQRLANLAITFGVPVHTDAVQAVGRIPVNFHALGVSTLAAVNKSPRAGRSRAHGPRIRREELSGQRRRPPGPPAARSDDRQGRKVRTGK